jgi:hypothetical protein
MFKVYLNDKEYTIGLKEFISTHIKNEGIEILRKIDDLDPQYALQRRMIDIVREVVGDEAANYGEDYQKLIADGKLSKEQINEMTDMGIEAARLQPATEAEIDKLRIELFKVLVDTKSVPTEIKEVWDTTEFWDNQNIEAITSEVDSFRTKFAAGN